MLTVRLCNERPSVNNPHAWHATDRQIASACRTTQIWQTARDSWDMIWPAQMYGHLLQRHKYLSAACLANALLHLSTQEGSSAFGHITLAPLTDKQLQISDRVLRILILFPIVLKIKFFSVKFFSHAWTKILRQEKIFRQIFDSLEF